MSLFKTSQLTHKYHLGFTMIEAMVVMILVAILAGSVTPSFLDVSKKRADIVMQDMQTIARAVRLYDSANAGFPEAGNNNCANAIGRLTSQNYIDGIETSPTAWGLGSEYIISCATTPSILSISVKTNAEWAPYISLGLPATISDGATSTMFVSKLSFVPDFSSVLNLQSSNTYRTTGAVDMNKFSLFNASPTLKINLPKRGIIVSSINSSAVTALPSLTETIGTITEFSSTQAIDSEITFTGASSYKYYRIQAVAEVTGQYRFAFTGNDYSVAYRSEKDNFDFFKDGTVSDAFNANLSKGETINLQIFHHSKGVNSNMLVRVRAPISIDNNFRGIAINPFLTIIDNKAKLLETNLEINTSKQYAIFPIWAESTPTPGVEFNWSFGDGVDTPTGAGIVLDATAQIIAMTANAEGRSATNGYLVRARNDIDVAREDGIGFPPQVVVSILANPAVDFLNDPSTYASGDIFNFGTTPTVGTPGPSIAAAWFRREVK